MASTPLRPARASSSRPTSACCSPSRPTNMSRVYGATRYEAMPAEVRARGLPGSEGAQAALTFWSGAQLHEEGTDDHYPAAGRHRHGEADGLRIQDGR